MLPEPPQIRVSLLPTRRRDYPSGSVALVSCHDVDAGLPVSSYACRPHATLIHSMPWVLISRRMLWEPPCWASQTLFICLADRTHPSVGGVLCPIGGFMGPLGQIPSSDQQGLTASRAGTPTPWTIPLQATRVLLARAPTTLLLHRQAGLTRPNAVSHRWASVEPSPTGRPKTTKFTPAVGGAHSCMLNRSLRARRPPRPATQATPRN